MFRLEYRTNNGNDWVILVSDGAQCVRSDWAVDADVLRDFLDCSQPLEDWDDREGDEHTPDQYGELVAIRMGYEITAVDHAKWNERVAFKLDRAS